MDRIVKVYCRGKTQAALARDHRILERYPGFALLVASPKQVRSLQRQCPTEDVTDLYSLALRNRTAGRDPTRTVAPRSKVSFSAPGEKLTPGWHHYIVQFVGPIKDAWLRQLEKVGAKPRAPYENFAYIVRSPSRLLTKIAALPFVIWIGHYPHRARIAATLVSKSKQEPSQLPRTRKLGNVYTVEFLGPEERRAATARIKRLGLEILNERSSGDFLIVRPRSRGPIRASALARLSAVHGVRIIRERTLKRPSNDVAVHIMGTASSLSPGKLGLSGKGEIVGVCDTGVDTGDRHHMHPDIAGRVTWIKSYPITDDFRSRIRNPGGDDGPADLDSGHGTHVVGSVLGNGAASAGIAELSAPIRGLAYKARLVFQAVEQELDWKDPADELQYGRYLLAGIPQDLGVLFGDAYRKGVRIHSNSWGGGAPGEYDEQCRQLDGFVWDHQRFCVVVSAGNDGTDKDGDGKINEMSVTSPGTAKNCITVGACENHRRAFSAETYGKWWPRDYPVRPFRDAPMADDESQIVAFSSRGPTQDGRVKPDVCAPGTFVLSTRSTQIAANNKAWAAFPSSPLYFYMGGTSMATPLTAGAVAIVRECLRKSHGLRQPTAALLKAALILGCQRLRGEGLTGALLDNAQGFGRVNLDAVLAPKRPSSAAFHDITRGLRTGEVRQFNLVVKSRKVPLRVVLAYSDYPGPALVNNLNLIVTAPDRSRHLGNQPARNALDLDTKNNVEVIHVRRPIPGTWKIEIVGSNVPNGPQPFSLAFLAHV